MKVSLFVAAFALLSLGGCETMSAPTLLERETIYNDQNLYIYSDFEEDLDGSRYWNFWAQNNNTYPICLGLTLAPNASTSGHSFDGKHYISPGQTKGVGYVYAPAQFEIESDVWIPDNGGNC